MPEEMMEDEEAEIDGDGVKEMIEVMLWNINEMYKMEFENI